jgi:hypothetical protein
MSTSRDPAPVNKAEVRRWIIATAVLHILAMGLFAIFFVNVMGVFLDATKNSDAEFPQITLMAIDLHNTLINLWFLLPVLLIGELIVLGLLRPSWPTLATLGSGFVILALFATVLWGAVTIVIPMADFVSRALS